MTQTTAAAGGTDPGLATFADLRLDRSGSYSFTASSAGLASATSQAFTVAAATPNQLAFVQAPPTSLTAGVAAASNTVVEGRDAGGQRVYDFQGPVTLSIENYSAAQGAATGSPMLSVDNATLTSTLTQGQASFADLRPNLTGSYTVQASAAGITGLATATFEVVPGAPASLAYTSPSAGTYGVALSQVGVTVLDALGNLATSATESVSMSASGGTGVLSGSLTQTPANGSASFSDLTVGPGPGPASAKYKLTATSGGLSSLGTEFLVEQLGEFFVSNGGNSQFSRPQQVATDAAGNFVVVWTRSNQQSSKHIFAQRYSAQGVAQGVELQVSLSPSSSLQNPTVAMDSDGDFVVVFEREDQSSRDILARCYNAVGEAQGPEFRVNTYTAGFQGFPSVAMSNTGEFVIVWQSAAQDGSGDGVYAQRFNAEGVAQGLEFRVNSSVATDQSLPSVAMDKGGNFVVVWETLQWGWSDIVAQRFNAFGVPEGLETYVDRSSLTNDSTYQPTVAMNSDGDYVVAWKWFTLGTTVSGVIKARRFTSGGVAQGEFIFVSSGNIPFYFGAVAVDKVGEDFMVAWYTGSNVYCRRFSSLGTVEGTALQVSGRYGTNPSVAMDDNGNSVIVWQGTGHGPTGIVNTPGVLARRFPAPTPTP